MKKFKRQFIILIVTILLTVSIVPGISVFSEMNDFSETTMPTDCQTDYYKITETTCIESQTTAETEADVTYELDPFVENLIKSKLTDKQKEILYNKDFYEESIKDINIDDKPILEFQNQILYYKADLSPDELWAFTAEAYRNHFEEAKKELNEEHLLFSEKFVVLGDKPLDLSTVEGNNVKYDRYGVWVRKGQSVEFYYPSECRVIKDIYDLKEMNIINDTECKLKDLYLFFDNTPWGAILFLETDKGVFVRYYDEPFSEAITMTQEEYKVFGSAYSKYLTDSGTNENGERLVGRGDSFGEFMRKNKELLLSGENSAGVLPSDVSNMTVTTASPKTGDKNIYLILALSVLLLTLILIFRKRESSRR